MPCPFHGQGSYAAYSGCEARRRRPGYVGLPLAVEFGKKRSVIGFDINARRIDALKAGHDHTLEVSDAELAEAGQLSYTADRAELGQANVFIVTVPTPIDEYKQPDLTPLVKASETIGAVLKRGDIVIYESTVYPAPPKRIACRCWSACRA